MSVRFLVGARKRPRSADPHQALEAAVTLARAASDDSSGAADFADLKRRLAPACRAYYTLAAITRRREIDESVRASLLSELFGVRVRIEKAVARNLSGLEVSALLDLAVAGSFFGASAKQGVGIRYALASCSPTESCGSRCYAHDGRDRELHHLFRSVLNWSVGETYESGRPAVRAHIEKRLEAPARMAVEDSIAESQRAEMRGFARGPRIRFSHIGDMGATPAFSNALARMIRDIDARVARVMYTRHPKARLLDASLFVMNFTIDGPDDPRLKHAPPHSRVVCSAWGGIPTKVASINFLEHHVEKVTAAREPGSVCPVIARHAAVASCDEARCAACFVPSEPRP